MASQRMQPHQLSRQPFGSEQAGMFSGTYERSVENRDVAHLVARIASVDARSVAREDREVAGFDGLLVGRVGDREYASGQVALVGRPRGAGVV